MADIFDNRWKVVRTLGEGGQAHAFIVTDIRASGDVQYVLKRLKNPARAPRFEREVEAVRSLDHRNIVKLVDFNLTAKRPYLVTEFCSGGSLPQASPQFWTNAPTRALDLFLQVCDGVGHAHAHGVVHRDIKPDNIFLRTPDGQAVVGDFGLAYIDTGDERLTETNEAIGPRLFAAPEVEDGRAETVSRKSDVYSLGKVLYWLMSGGKIFSREKHRDEAWDLKGRNIDSVLGWNNIYMEHVNRLLDLMIVVDPDERRSVDNIRILARRAIHLIRGEFPPVNPRIPAPCRYCGIGVYVLRAKTTEQVANLGLTPVGHCDWRVLVCNACGHCQMFRVDLAEHRDWWGT